MSFTGNEDHGITLTQASQWTKNYRTANPGAIRGHFFGKTAIQNILNQEGCVGIRIYYALDDSGVKQLIICGATSDEADIVNGLLAERSKPCPPYCGTKNPLNG